MADWSGVGRYSTSLVRALVRVGEVDVVQVLRPGQDAPAAEAEVVIADAASPFSLVGALALARAVRGAHAHVVHCLHFPTPIPAPHPLVVTLHDLIPLRFPAAMPSAVRRAAYTWWNARATRVAQRIIVPSNATARDVADTFPSAQAKLTVIAEAADDFSAGPVGVLPTIAQGVRYILGMGNTKAHKDLPALLHAFARLAPAYPDLRLILAGRETPGFIDGVLGADAAASRVAFTGSVTDEELRALYADAAAVALPSRYEGFGLPALEAMALGAPVVTADAAASLEVADGAAMAFPAGDADELAARLALLLDDEGERAALVKRGRERASAFTWDEAARLTAGVYRQVLG